MIRNPDLTRTRILDAAIMEIRRNGFAATSVDDFCKAAGVTKGAFFHHFKSKEDMAIAAAQQFGDFANQLFGNAHYMQLNDPVDRLIGYIDYRVEIMSGATHEYTCLLGTLVQEIHNSSDPIREAGRINIWGHIEIVIPLVKDALDSRGVLNFDARELATYTQTVLQGGFIMAKAGGSADFAKHGVRHLKSYLLGILNREITNNLTS